MRCECTHLNRIISLTILVAVKKKKVGAFFREMKKVYSSRVSGCCCLSWGDQPGTNACNRGASSEMMFVSASFPVLSLLPRHNTKLATVDYFQAISPTSCRGSFTPPQWGPDCAKNTYTMSVSSVSTRPDQRFHSR